MRKINLLHLKTSANIGGAEVMLTYWPRYLDKTKFEQFVILADEGPLLKIIKNLGVKAECFADLKWLKGFVLIPKLFSFIRKNKIDIIHAHGARVNLWGSVASILTGVPIIATEHSIDLWRGNTNLLNLLDRFSARVNKCRIGVSQAVCEMLFKQGLPSKKIICIENGIDIERFNIPIDISAKKKELGIPHNVKVIGTIGRFVEQKGHKYLLEAAKLIVNNILDIRFLIVGDGPLMQSLKNQVIQLGIEDKVIFTGQREDVPALLSVMDIFVLPSITEGLPLVLLEAMAAKKPIIASAVSGIPYVIEDEKNGLLVPPCKPDVIAEKIIYLFQNPARKKLFIDKAKKDVIEKYNARDMISQYRSLYEQVLERKKF